MQSNQTKTLIETKHKSCTEILDTLEKNVSERSSTPKYPCGLFSLDELVWGLHRQELLIIGARPSHGKTSLALQIAWNLAKEGKPSIFVSLEMSKENILERIMCNEFNINGFFLRKGALSEIKKMQESLLKFRARLLSNPIEIIDYQGRTIQEIRQILEHFRPEVLFIDHVQKITAKGYSSKYEALSDYVNRLQDYAIEFDTAIVLNSQINRGGEFLKGCGELEETADTLLYCNWVSHDDQEHKDKEEYIVSVEKQRHGPCSSTSLNFKANYYKFTQRVEKDRLL